MIVDTTKTGTEAELESKLSQCPICNDSCSTDSLVELTEEEYVCKSCHLGLACYD